MTEEKISKETLRENLDAIKRGITKRQRLYYHIDAVENFIYHLSNLPTERRQERTAKDIQNYLTLLEEKIKREHDMTVVAKELAPYIWNISHVYKLDLGFVSKPYYPFHLVLWAVLFFVFQSALSTPIALIAVTATVVSTIVYYSLKIKAKEYY